AGAESEIPAPQIYGPAEADISLVCWGSTYGPAREAVDVLEGKVNMIHFSAVEPLPAGAEEILRSAQKLVAVEGNSTGQLANLIRMRTGITVDGLISKYDGRPFRASFIVDRLKEVASW
ncbi:MAG: 2-oxoacid:acceptor oxidoreductase subunit alpha, partial [Anaerolineae bacterium]|nr:2-oxoacid:acceptor oxidoreductase subunit alpha [Anaerolineae bacterium]